MQPTAKSDLDDRQEALAAAVAAGKTVKAGAAQLGVSARTGYTWSSTPGFWDRVAELRREALDGALGELSAAASKAVRALVAALDTGDDSTPQTRTAAAKAVLSHAMDLQNHLDFEQRLRAVERRLGSGADDPTDQG